MIGTILQCAFSNEEYFQIFVLFFSEENAFFQCIFLGNCSCCIAVENDSPKPALSGSTTLRINWCPLGMAFSILATSKCRHPTTEAPSIFSIWSPTWNKTKVHLSHLSDYQIIISFCRLASKALSSLFFSTTAFFIQDEKEAYAVMTEIGAFHDLKHIDHVCTLKFVECECDGWKIGFFVFFMRWILTLICCCVQKSGTKMSPRSYHVSQMHWGSSSYLHLHSIIPQRYIYVVEKFLQNK